jgi:hypothetical protein
LVTVVEWRPKRGEYEKTPFQLVLVAHKDGKLLKIWLPSNHHKFSDGNQSFLVARKGGMPHVFQNHLTKAFQEHMTTPFCGN